MRVLIADDQALVRYALRTILEAKDHEVVGEAKTCREAVELALAHTPDVVLLDVDVAVEEVCAATEAISSRLPHTSVLVLTEHEDDDVLFAALRSGAKGYVTKDLEAVDFYSLLEQAGRGEAGLTPTLAAKVLDEFAHPTTGNLAPGGPSSLTPRERDVLTAMAGGTTSNRGLAEAMGVSQNTVRFHMRNILDKMHLHSRAAAVAYALTHGLVSSDGGSGH